MRYVIDRIEEGIAVCEREDRSHVEIPLEQLYPGAKEGDHFARMGEAYALLPEETEAARREILHLQAQLFEEE